MLDSIMDAVKGQVVSAISEKTGLDMGQAEQTLPIAKESITEGIMGAVSGGNVDGILGMLSSAVGGSDTSDSAAGGGLLQNMVYKGIAGNFISNVTSKLGLSEGVAGTLSSVALPMIMNKIGGATQAAGDTDGIDAGSMMDALGLDAGSLLGNLTAGAEGGAADLLGQAANMLGKGEDKAGGLLGKIGGMFK
ncbi:DUF937 domain-containing protein [Neolewinella aurantiaca]|uniref:DUF937 domain-containing protein n=1 Tax=Neolewinella aurantiaca TaxID=2602767 RepID=A0A5C7FMF4_9BACT|nr:DUF937 domain-containing protein [Neolewinella aurantiaca]TXF87564.1 DUF937 domain-containing protein [Neolewinella aurantiaca]